MGRRAFPALLMVALISTLFPSAVEPVALAGGPPNPFYVDASATGANTGETWVDAMTNLQAALSSVPSGSGVEIWVAEGTYLPGIDAWVSFELKNGVSLFGGFPQGGGSGGFGARDPVAYPTILSGDVMNGPTYHVVVGSYVDSSAVLDGFTIRDGHAVDASPTDPLDSAGGGMLLDHASPTLCSLRITSNEADGAGGGLFNSASDPSMESIEFSMNMAAYGGGMANDNSSPTLSQGRFFMNEASLGAGMDNVDSDPVLTAVSFHYNTATTSGGGMHNQGGYPSLEDCHFVSNEAGGDGGAMANVASDPRIWDSSFESNTARRGAGVYCEDSNPRLVNVDLETNSATNLAGTDGSGGGMYLLRSSPEVANARFHGNSAVMGGGGAYLSNDCVPSLTQVLFSGNEAEFGGGLYVGWNATLDLTSSTVAGNRAYDDVYGGGGVVVMSEGHLETTNSILSNNTATTGTQELDLHGSGTANVTFSLLKGGCSGPAVCDHVVTAEAEFVRLPGPGDDGTWGTYDDDAGDLRLTSLSPAIDAGYSKLLPADNHDLDGDADTGEALPLDIEDNSRMYDRKDVADGDGDWLDMGVHETPPDHLYVDVDATGSFTGLSWANALADLQEVMEWGRSGPMEVWVAQGTYTPGESPEDSFILLSEMAVYGGFPAGGGEFVDRDRFGHETILSGDLGVKGDDTDNAAHVVFTRYVRPTAILDGFTISGGNAMARSGGGWRNESGDPTLVNICFSGNQAATGGGMLSLSGAPRLQFVEFVDNVATGVGGGLSNHYGDPNLWHVLFISNEAAGGAGMYSEYGNPFLGNVQFHGNVAGQQGGGLFSELGDPGLQRVTFKRNEAHTGAGMYSWGGGPTLVNAQFLGNVAAQDGGGYYGTGDLDTTTIRNSVFSGNEAAGLGGGMAAYDAEAVLTSVTFASNSAMWGGGLAARDSAVLVHNSVLWGNGAATPESSQVYGDGSTIYAGYDLIANGCPATYADCTGPIVDADPLFRRNPDAGSGGWGTPDDDYGDLDLDPGSPAADAGANHLVGQDTYDLDGDGDTSELLPRDVGGKPRFLDSPEAPDTGTGTGAIVDMGAYEALYVGFIYLPAVLRSH